ncbi:hypothetical protein SLEP1_g40499 [Rubroshorea leprosula]|uniref:Isopenicillin N synthase-like Fe(2+) 2OG dioxygenase domain-containing protein n=1 Tax=Rubroshorea leprosula TaxID=152421 RepID=A0AAV5L3R5_9ROSI|nr:hypothetical protein SLEP1_g40499 [Rubroshorea leprosula]
MLSYSPWCSWRLHLRSHNLELFLYNPINYDIASNGEYKSVQHRVLANSDKNPRISVVEFFNLSKWKGNGYYGPLPELLSAEKPAIYRNFTEQEFLENFYSKGYDSKSLIEKIKIES